jgi:hypothetical protein
MAAQRRVGNEAKISVDATLCVALILRRPGYTRSHIATERSVDMVAIVKGLKGE